MDADVYNAGCITDMVHEVHVPSNENSGYASNTKENDKVHKRNYRSNGCDRNVLAVGIHVVDVEVNGVDSVPEGNGVAIDENYYVPVVTKVADAYVPEGTEEKDVHQKVGRVEIEGLLRVKNGTVTDKDNVETAVEKTLADNCIVKRSKVRKN